MLEVVNLSPLDVSVPVKTAPATTAIMMAAMEPIQNDFIAASLPKMCPLKPGGQ